MPKAAAWHVLPDCELLHTEFDDGSLACHVPAPYRATGWHQYEGAIKWPRHLTG